MRDRPNPAKLSATTCIWGKSVKISHDALRCVYEVLALYPELFDNALEPVQTGCGHLLELVGQQAVEDAKVGGKAGSNGGNFVFVPLTQDLLDGVIQQQAVVMLGRQRINQLSPLPDKAQESFRNSATLEYSPHLQN